MEDFFETSVNLMLSFPFLNIHLLPDQDRSQLQELESNWQKCLQLNEKEAGNFTYMTLSNDNNPVHFRFDAVGIKSPPYNDHPLVLFAVKKYTAKNNSFHNSKTRDNYQKDYAEFIEIAAHDLDAPLRKISLLVDRLIHKIQPGTGSDLQVYFDRIQTSLTDMRSLIDNLSALASLSPVPVQAGSCDIGVIINETLGELRYKYPDKKIVANYPALLLLEGDRSQYRQLFQHLLKNAVCYSKTDEPVTINISTTSFNMMDENEWQLHPGKNYSKITIMDTGIGFGQEYAQKIFRPFTRLHGKSEYPGTGMGLAICKKIVENHGGIIYAESDENKGATFIIILPQFH